MARHAELTHELQYLVNAAISRSGLALEAMRVRELTHVQNIATWSVPSDVPHTMSGSCRSQIDSTISSMGLSPKVAGDLDTLSTSIVNNGDGSVHQIRNESEKNLTRIDIACAMTTVNEAVESGGSIKSITKVNNVHDIEANVGVNSEVKDVSNDNVLKNNNYFKGLRSPDLTPRFALRTSIFHQVNRCIVRLFAFGRV